MTYAAGCYMIIGMKTFEQIDAAIEERRKDSEFVSRLRQRHESERALYDRLAKR